MSRRISPNAYCYNNPMRFIDPDGMGVIEIEGGVCYTGEDAVNQYKAYKAAYSSNNSEQSDEAGVENDDKDPKKKTNSERTLSYWEIIQYNLPVLDKAKRADDSFREGNYFDCLGYICLGVVDVATLGIIPELDEGLTLARAYTGFSKTATEAGENIVYHSVEAGVTKYAGITNDFARRAAKHLATKGIKIEPLMKGLSRADARAVEQALIEIHGLGKNGGTLLNKINSISPKNPVYKSQLQRGYELLKSIGY